MSGMLYNFTGNGKGKTSAALGIALRMLGWGGKIAVIQFIKDETPTGERRFFMEHFPRIEFLDCGAGLTDGPGDHAGCASSGWLRAKQLLREFDGELLILDELNDALAEKLIPVDDAVQALKNRRKELHVVVTGRDAPREIIELSDLTSEIQAVKHPFEHGIQACRGLDY